MSAPQQSPVDSLTAYLSTLDGRCEHGAHLATQGCLSCAPVAPSGVTPQEWAVFVDAVKSAAGPDRVVRQRDVRPLIRGRIEPKHIGTAYRQAKASGLLVEFGHEESDDHLGKNAGRLEPRYQLGAAA